MLVLDRFYFSLFVNASLTPTILGCIRLQGVTCNMQCFNQEIHLSSPILEIISLNSMFVGISSKTNVYNFNVTLSWLASTFVVC